MKGDFYPGERGSLRSLAFYMFPSIIFDVSTYCHICYGGVVV